MVFQWQTPWAATFLLILCLGIVLLGADKPEDLRVVEVAWAWASSLVLGAVVLFGSRRWIGAGMFLAYVVFLVPEFTLFSKVTSPTV